MNAKLPKGFAPILRSIHDESRRRKTDLLVVGGCVRDWLLGLETKDLDFISQSDPVPVARSTARRWGGELETFERFGTARVLVRGGFRIDFARAREETYASPAALPDVRPGAIAQDLIRRDFTVNAMAASLNPEGFGDLLDPHGGARDLRRKELRVLHRLSFRDDPTRMYRAARFARRFGFRLGSETEQLRQEAMLAGWVKLLSRERLRGELARVLEEKRPVPALRQLHAWGLAEAIHPRLAWPADLDAGLSVWERLGMMALRMGSPEGDKLIESLHLERYVSLALLEALKLAREKASPRTPVAPLTADVLRKSFRRLRPRAIHPLLIDGRDIQNIGVAPGPVFKQLLEQAAKSQWAGKLSTRAEALAWLRRRRGR